MPLSSLDEFELVDLAAEETGAAGRQRLLSYRPYAKQKTFHAAGAQRRERLLMAGNQLGKTYCGAAEAAFHLTGLYPDWWEGRRWNRPVRAWAASKTAEVTRDGVQRLLVGEPRDRGAWGEGMIPGERLIERKLRQSLPDALGSVTVQHAGGGRSVLGFKSYDQGRAKWQGETLDFVWFDEEPPLDVYMEGLTRTNATGGMTFMTFTPLLGMSEVVSLFLDDGKGGY
jgi:phage terminase large subunit-like protein